MGRFVSAKYLFKDVVNVNNYVPLASTERAKIDLLNAIFDTEKLILLIGEAGTGKSLLLRKVYLQLKNNNKRVFFVSNPYSDINKILNILSQINLKKEHIVVLIDEAQLLTPSIWENLRIYADEGNISIVFSTHHTDIQDLLKQKHFKTRINNIISLKKVTLKETQNFIITKLIRNDLHNIAEMFKMHNFKFIYKYTKGSLRTTNQLMYKLFDVLEYFDNKYPKKIGDKISNKYIYITAMDLRLDDE